MTGSTEVIQGQKPAWMPVSTVWYAQDKTLPGTHRCPAARQGNNCGSCRACWNPRVKIVDFPLT